ARPDLGRMVTNDYADARELGSDPLKTTEQHAFRPTSRIWDISNPAAPKLISVAHMPKSFKNTPNPAHDNLGIMEGAKTYAPSKGMFSESMCGGGIFFLPDVTNVQPDSSSQWKQVWDDGMTEMQVPGRDIRGAGGGRDHRRRQPLRRPALRRPRQPQRNGQRFADPADVVRLLRRPHRL